MRQHCVLTRLFVADGELEFELVKAVFPHCRKICCVEANAYFVRQLEEKKKILQDMEVGI